MEWRRTQSYANKQLVESNENDTFWKIKITIYTIWYTPKSKLSTANDAAAQV